MPLVSVIIPNFNHALYLETRIKSVLGQTFEDYELIILDDCSTDSSRKIIDSYKSHPKVSHVVYNEHNSGSTFKQWRKGLDLAKGEWIWIAESDDYCTRDLLQVLVSQVEKLDNVVLSYCQSNEVDENGHGWRDMSWHTNKVDKDYWKRDYTNNGLDEINKVLWRINSIPNASAVIFKKAAYLKFDRSFETMKFCGDWMLWIQLMTLGNIAFCATPLNYFRNHSLTTRVHDNIGKWRRNLEEEYQIANYVVTILSSADKKKVRSRRRHLLYSYCGTFTLKDIKKIVFNRRSQVAPFPMFKFYLVFLARFIYSKLRRVLPHKLFILATK